MAGSVCPNPRKRIEAQYDAASDGIVVTWFRGPKMLFSSWEPYDEQGREVACNCLHDFLQEGRNGTAAPFMHS